MHNFYKLRIVSPLSTFLICLLLSSSVFAGDKKASFMMEWPLSPVSSAPTLIGVDMALTAAEDFALEKYKFDASPGIKILERSLEWVLVWLPINYGTMLLQHEYFGHAMKALELGADATLDFDKNSIRNLPWPYGAGVFGAAAANWDNYSAAKDFLVNLAGVAASDVMSEKLAYEWLQNGSIDGRTGFLYFVNTTQTTGYIYVGKAITKTSDITKYLNSINAFLKGTNQARPDPLTIGTLRWAAAVNLLDPIFYFSIYSIYKYAAFGETLDLPMIHFSDSVAYMPIPSMSLSAFGPNYQLNNLLQIGNRNYLFYGNFGKLENNTWGGFGVVGDIFSYKSLSVGAKLKIESQPKLMLDANTLPQDAAKLEDVTSADQLFGKQQIAFEGTLNVGYRFFKLYGLQAEIGYKTEGYFPGEKYDKAFIFRAGATLYL